jgi:hypothetical protein
MFGNPPANHIAGGMIPMNVSSIAALSIALCALILALWIFIDWRRSRQLKSQFGPEYDRLIMERGGDRKNAESELERRTKRVEHLNLRPIYVDDRLRFAEAWRIDQTHFVDNPHLAVEKADKLVQEVMIARGYPVTDFEQRAADISVDHPEVVDHYRSAHGIALRDRRGEASTEELRQAMIHFRALFEELLEQRVAQKV